MTETTQHPGNHRPSTRRPPAAHGTDERRRLPRAPASLQGALQRMDGVTLGCRTRDASLTGLFLELAADEPALREGGHVGVEFIVRERDGTRRYRAEATVVHSADRGIGLNFDRHQLNILGYLYGLVHGAPAERRRTLESVRLRVLPEGAAPD